MRNFADRLRELFGGIDNDAEIARRLDLGPTTVRNYLAGERLPTAEILMHIRKLTGCSLDWLLTGEGLQFCGQIGISDVDFVPLRLEQHVQSRLIDLAKREGRSIDDEAVVLVSEALVARGEYINKTEGMTLVYLSETSPKLVGIPLLGLIAAGKPIEAIEEPEVVEVAEDFTTMGQRTFALRVVGDSMKDENIVSGDVIICRESPTANPGDMVVALVNGDSATVKRFYRRGRQIVLKAANPEHKDMILSSDQIVIRGIVVGIQRRP